MVRRHVYVIGLDGVPPRLLDRAIDAGRIPTLERLRTEGASGTTRSTIPPMSMMAWSTFATGRRPGNHGVFNFTVKASEGHGFEFVNSDRLWEAAPPVWEYADAKGVPTGIVNLMPGYPVSRTRGYHVADYITTPSGATATYPVSLQSALDGLVGGYSPGLPSDLDPASGADGYRDYVQRLFECERGHLAVGEYLLDRYDCPLTAIVFSGPDVLLHNVGHLRDEEHPHFDPNLAGEFGDAPLALLEAYDVFLEGLVEDMEEEDVLIVLSDHGHSPLYGSIDLNAWLYQANYLTLENSLWTRLKVCAYNRLFDTIERVLERVGLYYFVKHAVARSSNSDGGFDLATLLTISHEDVDWTSTLAFTLSGGGQIYLNDTTRHAVGTVDPGEYDRVIADLRESLAALEDPETGDPVFTEVLLGTERYAGAYVEQAPDLVCVPADDYEVTFPQTMQTERVFGEPNKPAAHTGAGDLDGIFVAWGGPVGSQSGVEMDLVDFAPAALGLLNLPVPRSMDGEPRQDVFDFPVDPERKSYDGRVTATRSVRQVVADLTGC